MTDWTEPAWNRKKRTMNIQSSTVSRDSDFCLQRSLTDTCEHHKWSIFLSVYGEHASRDSTLKCWEHLVTTCYTLCSNNLRKYLTSQYRGAAVKPFTGQRHITVWLTVTSHSRFWVLRAAWGISCSAREPDSCNLECGDRKDGGGNEAFNPVLNEKSWMWVAYHCG